MKARLLGPPAAGTATRVVPPPGSSLATVSARGGTPIDSPPVGDGATFAAEASSGASACRVYRILQWCFEHLEIRAWRFGLVITPAQDQKENLVLEYYSGRTNLHKALRPARLSIFQNARSPTFRDFQK